MATKLSFKKVEKDIKRDGFDGPFYKVIFFAEAPETESFEVKVWIKGDINFIDVVPRAKKIIENSFRDLAGIAGLGSKE